MAIKEAFSIYYKKSFNTSFRILLETDYDVAGNLIDAVGACV